MSSTTTQVYGGRASITFHSAKHYYAVTIPERNIDDLFQPSVTSIIGKLDKSAALMSWSTKCVVEYITQELEAYKEDVVRLGAVRAIVARAKDAWKSVRDEKADIGSVVHRVLEQELNARAGLCDHPVLPVKLNEMLAPGITQEMLSAANNAIFAGFQFFDEHKIEIVAAESVRWSPRYGYLGTGDLIAKVDGQLAMLDYKTSKKLYPTVWLQLAAYQMAWQEEHADQPLSMRLAINVGRDGTLETKMRDNTMLASDFQAFLGLLVAWRWDRENTDYYPKAAPLIVGAFN